MRDADPTLPDEAVFSGAVQAMGFRFQVDEPVVPMRLSAYNPGELHNIVYLLTDGPAACAQLPKEMVTHQIAGRDLLDNMTQSLPADITWQTAEGRKTVHVRRGERARLPDQFNQPWFLGQIAQQRDPGAHNAKARDQIAGAQVGDQRRSANHVGASGHQCDLRHTEIAGLHDDVAAYAQ